MGCKKNSKYREKKFFFRNGHNYLKVTKKAQKSKFGPILLHLEPFFTQILRCAKSPIWYVPFKMHYYVCGRLKKEEYG